VRVSATTATIGSPTYRTLSLARIVRATVGLNGDGDGSRPRSPAVKTPRTPGMAAASDESIDVIVPWATAERT
jgi:hypothetical protein